MSLYVRGIVLLCADRTRMAQFWSAALQRPLQQSGDRWQISLTDTGEMNLFLQEGVDETAGGPRLRLCVRDGSFIEARVAYLLQCGARIIKNASASPSGRMEAILQDPEGHAFVVEESDEEAELRRSLDSGT